MLTSYTYISQLFPFNRCRWLTADIIYHPVNSFYIINDFVGDIGQEIHKEDAPSLPSFHLQKLLPSMLR